MKKQISSLVLFALSVLRLVGADFFAVPPLTPAGLAAYSNAVNLVESPCAVGAATFTATATAASGPATWRDTWIFTHDATKVRLHYFGGYSVNGQFNNAYLSGYVAFGLEYCDDTGAPISGALYTIPTFSSSTTGNFLAGKILDSDWTDFAVTNGARASVSGILPNSTNSLPASGVIGLDSGNGFYANSGLNANAVPSFDTTGQTGATAIQPGCITCMMAPQNVTAVLELGDSIAQHANGPRLSVTNTGWLVPALWATGGTNIPVVNVSIGGSRLVAQNDPSSFPSVWAPPAKWRFAAAVVATGFNDFFGSGYSAPTVEKHALATIVRLRKMGIPKVIFATVKPGTTTSDCYLTEAGQTARSGDDQRLLYNTWLTNQLNSGVIDGLFDLAAALCSATNTSIAAVGPMTVIATGTAATSSSGVSLYHSSVSTNWLGKLALVVDNGTNYMAQITGYRSGSPGRMLFASAPQSVSGGTLASFVGDTFTIYDGWAGDMAGVGAHPSGSGHARIASRWPTNLTTLIRGY